MHNLRMGKTLWNIKLELFLLDLFFILTSFSSLSLSLSLRLPWHSIIKLARTSRFPVPHVWNPITRQQFMLCEDALLFQYWDVKLHTGPLMHSGNHSLLLRLLATKLSEDLVTGERKSELLTFSPLSLSLSFLTMTSFSYSVPLCSLSFPLSISPVFLGGVSLPRAPWQGDWWGGLNSLTVDIYQETLLGMPMMLASPQTNRQADGWKCLRKDRTKLHRLITLYTF